MASRCWCSAAARGPEVDGTISIDGEGKIAAVFFARRRRARNATRGPGRDRRRGRALSSMHARASPPAGQHAGHRTLAGRPAARARQPQCPRTGAGHNGVAPQTRWCLPCRRPSRRPAATGAEARGRTRHRRRTRAPRPHAGACTRRPRRCPHPALHRLHERLAKLALYRTTTPTAPPCAGAEPAWLAFPAMPLQACAVAARRRRPGPGTHAFAKRCANGVCLKQSPITAARLPAGHLRTKRARGPRHGRHPRDQRRARILRTPRRPRPRHLRNGRSRRRRNRSRTPTRSPGCAHMPRPSASPCPTRATTRTASSTSPGTGATRAPERRGQRSSGLSTPPAPRLSTCV